MTDSLLPKNKSYDWSHLYTEEHALTEPLILNAEIVHGFQRGSKDLGIPTANLSMDELGDVGDNLQTGIYYGIGKVDGVEHAAVVSVGWNPFYKNIKKTVEAHLLSKLEDFYGKKMELTLFGYLRQETTFNGLGKIICIKHCLLSDYLFTCLHFLQTNLFPASTMTLKSLKIDCTSDNK
jgi:riboflavin kinase